MRGGLYVGDTLSPEELKKKIKTAKFNWLERRWRTIYYAKTEKITAEDLGKRMGYGTQTIYNILSNYNNRGVEGIETKGRGQRQRAYMSTEEEKEFLEPFVEKAMKGQIATVSEIHQALEKHLEHSVDLSTVSRLLKRNGWRKIQPRPAHPLGNKEKREAFKKKVSRRSRKHYQSKGS